MSDKLYHSLLALCALAFFVMGIWDSFTEESLPLVFPAIVGIAMVGITIVSRAMVMSKKDDE